MNILVIGGTGFISSRVVHMLLGKSHRVTVLHRGQTKSPNSDHPNLEIIIGNRTDPGVLKGIAAHRNFDAIYDFVAYEPQESRAAAETFFGKVGRFIHCSTVSVYMVSDAVRCPISEDQDDRPVMENPQESPFGMEYGLKKRQCETVLLRSHDDEGFPVSMLRPTFVCGPQDATKRDFFWIERILDGQPLLVPGSGDLAFQQVYADDVAQAFVSLLDKEASAGEAYNVASDEIYSLNEYLQLVGELLGIDPELVHVDQEIFDQWPYSTNPEGDVFPFNTKRTAVFSIEKIKRDLKFRPTSFNQWMPATIEYFTGKPRLHSTGYEQRHLEVKFLRRWQRFHRSKRDILTSRMA